MPHIMLDIETLDTTTTAVVLSIGAVVFDPFSRTTGEEFYMECTDLTEQQRLGRTISADTVKWWMKQSPEARELLTADPRPESAAVTRDVLTEFKRFVHRNGDTKAEIWGNGADFDNIVLGSLFDTFMVRRPWSYNKNRCYRTMRKMLAPDLPVKRSGVYHNALDDAITQALHLQEIFACLKHP